MLSLEIVQYRGTQPYNHLIIALKNHSVISKLRQQDGRGRWQLTLRDKRDNILFEKTFCQTLHSVKQIFL